MKIRRTISIDRKDIETLRPLLDSNGNNLSQAIRQLIDEHRCLKDQNRISDEKRRVMMLRNQIIENRIAELVPVPLIKWLLKNNHGVPPLGIFRVILEKYTKLLGIDNLSVNDYVRLVKTHSELFGYQLSQDIEVSPDSRNIRISFESEDSNNLKGTVVNYSCLVAHNPLKLKIKKVVDSPYLIIVDYEQCSGEEEAYRSVLEYFGHNQFVIDEIQNNIQFWRNAVQVISSDNYEDIIISKEIFLQLLRSRDFSDELNNLIFSIFGVSVEDTDYQNIIRFIDTILRTNGLIDRIEHNDNEIKIHHKFNDKNVIISVNETILKTLGSSGHDFMPKKKGKLTILGKK